uniref:Uncharacterized protein n=1 Tax=Odontella aurita TaxID=265563 RepID=A0A7S4IY64_9STRA|mmetsp:Transcript_32858/g.97934  ORF Transcript_32858/g.97934 Transcript_32858/m.97934 type:complete len:315 (+) Transcript_32858:156-1100(+)|eukprot:CAMPEP_0113558878 /NCGR_PEP_ID=MMETSP0015_2-20120614/18592_1 /TAXON_ID=2838 /ORGANISM="Odontella" /LENGTH=314 /DNA_ID=CAMNT_0000460465 /DNA_START=103 /DNA_END=1047 /DNA_ORIENTATION=- /assembly_acc=CAM_ASM_000160
MINLYPSGYYYDDFDPSYSDPRLRRQLLRRAQLQQQAAMEEEQRRQQMRYERAMREEQMWREQMLRQDILERKRRNLEHQRRREEMVRRQALEQSRRDAEKRRRILERQWQQQRQRELELERQLDLERIENGEQKRRRQGKMQRDAEYGIVRGPDGRLYKLHSDDMHGYDGSFGGVNPMHRGRSEKLLRPMPPPLMKPLNVDETYPVSTSEEIDSDEEVSDIAPTERHTKVSTNMVVSDAVKKPNATVAKRRTKSAGKKSKPTKKTVVKSSVLIGDVEDASDSEQEDLASSIWRNRMPSEGEWMEPVQGYDIYF